MMQAFDACNYKDESGSPGGGYVKATGLDISWQAGPLGRGEDRKEPNGAFVETVIAAALQRIEYYQMTKFACIENERVCENLKDAIRWLRSRTQDREKRGVEGTHQT
jgi:hypothetical protein